MYSRIWSGLRTHRAEINIPFIGLEEVRGAVGFQLSDNAKHFFQTSTENTILCSSSVLQFQEAKAQNSNTANWSVGQGAISQAFFLCY